MPFSHVRSLSCLLDTSEDISAGGAPACRSLRAWVRGRGDPALALLILGSIVVVGVALGSVLPASDELHGPYRRISAIIGWTYFCSWSVSFYPQVLLNYRRRTSVGLSFDFLLYNVLAFSCYSAFTCSLYWSKSIQRAYDKRHAGQPNKVQLNDAVFALHATFVSFFTLAQVVYYDWRDRKQRPSSAAVAVCGVILASSSAYAMSVWAGQTTRGYGSDRGLLNWLDFLYFLSYVKVVTGIIKYVPQVILNIRRHSTAGWTIWNVILDLTGGLLSVVQLVLDCWNTGDWGGIAGYPVKFAIGFVSVFFDLIFLFQQHYVLYPQPRAVIKVDGFLPSGTASTPLLREGARGGGGGGWWIDEEDDGSSTREE
ncbi:unnamed protein product [Ectocarpus sp. 4 AP-2014]